MPDKKVVLGLLVPIVVIGIVVYQTTYGAGGRRVIAFCGSASMPALEEAAHAFEERTGMEIELHFGGSGGMLSSMEMSKSGDLYIPGSPDYMARAIEHGVVRPETMRRIAYLVPAIIVQEGNPKNITCLDDLARSNVTMGIGDPESVCVGGYAVELLEHNGLWENVSGNIVVHAESCSKTAALVTLRTVDATIGWRVFERWNPDKTDVVFIKPEQIPRLSYVPAAVSVYAENQKGAQSFLDFLVSREGQMIFGKWGYIATEAEAREYAPWAMVPELPSGSSTLAVSKSRVTFC
ncbi:MAG: molybdate ABC transporter substrate-binding protein [Candidatus Bathyarchaeia archaeon]